MDDDETPDFSEAFGELRRVVAAGVGGSRSHGLNHADSDWDVWAVYQAPAVEFLGLWRPKETKDFKVEWGDVASHELGKWVALAAKGNPTVVERLFSDTWLPDYTTPVGESLREQRDMFVTANLLRQYAGYIGGQKDTVLKVEPGSRKWRRAAKHTLRLSFCVINLVRHRRMTVRLEPQVADELMGILDDTHENVTAAVVEWEAVAQNEITSALEHRKNLWPDTNMNQVNAWLVATRVSDWLAP
jgi:hypothetical protein